MKGAKWNLETSVSEIESWKVIYVIPDEVAESKYQDGNTGELYYISQIGIECLN